MSTREERLIENETVARGANERLESALASRTDREQAIPFLCECADHPCLGKIEISAEEFDRIHAEPSRFIVLAGHPLIDGERIVDDRGSYQVVEKGDE